MKIAIVGSGYVGLVAAACLAEIGHHVTCIDNDEKKIAALNAGDTTIHEEFLPELLERHRGRRLSFTRDLCSAVRDSKIVFIAVGTPPCGNGEADVSGLESVCREIAGAIDDFKLIVVKSTVPVGTNAWIRRIIVRCGTPKNLFEVAANPEFLREGTAVTDFLYPDRIVIGRDNGKSSRVLRELYKPISSGQYSREKNAVPRPDSAVVPCKVVCTGTRSAEIIKHSSNAFLAMKISFINAVANVCEAAGADIQEVCEGIGTDQRIGRHFLRPGIGYGGSCFPKDLKAFQSVAREYGQEFRLLDEVVRINELQCERFLRKVRSALWTLKNKRVAVLGLAFKGGTDDIRESPAIELVRMLLKDECKVIAYDPAAMERARQQISDPNFEFASNAYEAAKNADALLILTDWEEFASLDLSRLRRHLKNPIVVDGRNLYSLEEMAGRGFSYFSIGRRESVPVEFVEPSNGKSDLIEDAEAA